MVLLPDIQLAWDVTYIKLPPCFLPNLFFSIEENLILKIKTENLVVSNSPIWKSISSLDPNTIEEQMIHSHMSLETLCFTSVGKKVELQNLSFPHTQHAVFSGNALLMWLFF